MTEMYGWINANKELIIRVVESIAFICILGVCFPKWCDICYQFGGTIYTLIHCM